MTFLEQDTEFLDGPWPFLDAAPCTLRASVYGADGQPQSGVVFTVRLQQVPLAHGGKIISQGQIKKTTAADGLVEFTLSQGVPIYVTSAVLGMRKIAVDTTGKDAIELTDLL